MTGAVSAIVVSYHTGPVLFDCLQSLLASPVIGEVIVVDNGNPPEVIADLKKLQQRDFRLRHIAGHGNIGFAAASNKGADIAGGTHFLLFNPDAILPAGGAERLLGELEEASGDKKLIGGRLIGADGEEQAGSRRNELTPGTAFAEMTRLDRITQLRRFNFHKDPLPDKTIPVPTISGACMLMTNASFHAIGGMDEGYFLHVEDVDFCLRFRQAGGRVYFCPYVDITHEKGTSGQSPIRVERWKAQSLIRYFRRHYADQSPPGAVLGICGFVWIGFAIRAVLASFFRR